VLPAQAARGAQRVESLQHRRSEVVFECFLTEAEKARLLGAMRQVIEQRVRTMGIAVAPEDPPYFYVG
jgi:hypothetical protein